MNVLLSFTHRHLVPVWLSTVEHKMKIFWRMFQCFFFSYNESQWGQITIRPFFFFLLSLTKAHWYIFFKISCFVKDFQIWQKQWWQNFNFGCYPFNSLSQKFAYQIYSIFFFLRSRISCWNIRLACMLKTFQADLQKNLLSEHSLESFIRKKSVLVFLAKLDNICVSVLVCSDWLRVWLQAIRGV